MVSFSCEACGDVLIKKKLDAHRRHCFDASFTCLDCRVTFKKTEYRDHTSCITEAQKYQGALYHATVAEKESRKQKQKNTANAVQQHHKTNFKHTEQHVNPSSNPSKSTTATPSLPDAKKSENSTTEVNVFDFLVYEPTPNSSVLNLPTPEPMQVVKDDFQSTTQRQSEPNNTHSTILSNNLPQNDISEKVQKNPYQTPNQKHSQHQWEGRKEKRDRVDETECKERKRLHLETLDLVREDDDETMTDIPPIICNSGLTGGLDRLMACPASFPPTPDYSGGDIGDPSPRTPLKKGKHVKKRAPPLALNSSLRAFMSRPSRHQPEDRSKRRQNKDGARENRQTKLVNHNTLNGGVVVYHHQPPVSEKSVELLFSLINKGPESTRGVSMNKALKKYHRERQTLGIKTNKAGEEKELWKLLRLKRNDRGEIVLFV